MSEQQQLPPRVRISGLWQSETKKGQTYWSGSNGSVRYSIWPNGYAEGENDPTHVLYIEPVTKKKEESDKSMPF